MSGRKSACLLRAGHGRNCRIVGWDTPPYFIRLSKKLHSRLIACVGATIGRPPTCRSNAFSGTVFLQGKRARASNARPYKSFSTPCNTFISIVYPNPAPKEKRQFSQGVCKKLYKTPKSMLSLLQKSVKAAFLSRVHKFGVQLFCTSTDCTNGVQKSGLHCAKNCSMLKTQKGSWI